MSTISNPGAIRQGSWDAGYSYNARDVVLGNDGRLYSAVASSAGVEPRPEGGAYWRPMPAAPSTITGIALTKAYHGGSWQTNGGSASQQSNGVDAGSTYRLQHYATAPSAHLRFLFGNSAQENLGTNPITVKAAVESAAGAICPLYFQGSRTVTIQPGGFALSDPVGVDLAQGDSVWSRTYVSAANGGRWWLGAVHQLPGEGETNSDAADGGTIPSGLGYSYCPLAVYGSVPAGTPTVAIFGDSISAGVGAEQDSPTNFDGSYPVLGLGPHFGSRVGHICLAQNAEAASWFLEPTHRRLRMRLAEHCTHAIVALGINDIDAGASLATMQANLRAIWTLLSDKYGMRVWQSTITPFTVSTDGFATVENQMPKESGHEAVRVALNNWIRTTPAPLAGYFEIADRAETARDSGRWRVGLTQDGLHPSGYLGHSTLAKGIDISRFF